MCLLVIQVANTNFKHLVILMTVDNLDITCVICTDSIESEGEHRIVSLACGHLFGKNCIEKWITSKRKKSSTCPQCHQPCKFSHIRMLYTEAIRPLNTKEKQFWEDLLEKEKHKNFLAEHKIQQLTFENQFLRSELLAIQMKQNNQSSSHYSTCKKYQLPLQSLSIRCLISPHRDYLCAIIRENMILKISLLLDQSIIISTLHNSGKIVKMCCYEHSICPTILMTLGSDMIVCLINWETGNTLNRVVLSEIAWSLHCIDRSDIIYIGLGDGSLLSMDIIKSTIIERLEGQTRPSPMHSICTQILDNKKNEIIISSSRSDIIIHITDDNHSRHFPIQSKIVDSISKSYLNDNIKSISCIYMDQVVQISNGLLYPTFVMMFKCFPISKYPNTIFIISTINYSQNNNDECNVDVAIIHHISVPSILQKCISFKRSECIYLITCEIESSIADQSCIKLHNMTNKHIKTLVSIKNEQDSIIDIALISIQSPEFLGVAYCTTKYCEIIPIQV